MEYPVSLPQALQTIDEMQARITALESAAGQGPAVIWRLRKVFELSPQGAKMVALLSKGLPKSSQQLYDVMDSGSAYWSPSSKIVDVRCSEIRKRMYSRGFDLTTRWGAGKQLKGPLADLRRLMRGEIPELAVLRGDYVPMENGRDKLSARSIAGRLLHRLSECHSPDVPFEIQAIPLSKEIGAAQQTLSVASGRLCELGYLIRLSKGVGRHKFPVYKLTKTMEKAA